MNIKLKLKLITIFTIFIILFNTTSTFAISLSRIDSNNSNTSTTEIGRIKDKFINLISNKFKEKDSDKIQSLENFELDFENVKSSFEQQNRNFFNRFFITSSKTTSKNKIKYFSKNILAKYVCSDEEAERLADVISNLETDIDWSYDTIKTFLYQLIKALYNTTYAIPTQEDMKELGEQLTSGEYYHLDLDDNGNEVADDVEVTYSTIQDIGRLCNYASIGYERANKAPISIGKIAIQTKDTKSGTTEVMDDVYLVALAGTNFIEEQSCGLIADVLSGTESNSPYLQNSLKAILETVPKGSKIMLTGFSLGGMIAQQIMVQSVILENYDIVQVTLLGCPALCVEERDVAFAKYNVAFPINRVIDKYDLVPYLCIDYLLDKVPNHIDETLYTDEANPRYKTFVGTHFIGYLKEDCWKNYDVLGNKIENGKISTMTLRHGDFQYFDAPTEYTSGKISAIE